jgi:hypothetical protein
MKKIAAIILIIVYGASVSGMTLHLHYCCGKVEKINFLPAGKSDCSKSMGLKKPMKQCCDDKLVSLKIKSDQKTETGPKLLDKLFQSKLIYLVATDIEKSGYWHNKTGFTDNSPPWVAATPVYIIYCTYRI